MRKSLVVFMLFCAVAVHALRVDDTKTVPGPSRRGTINVLVANDQGIVVLTDSMLTETGLDASGILTSRQSLTPGQKLFQIDGQTVCAFAGFAWADTSPLSDFLNSVPDIMGRFQDRLRRTPGALSVSDKLELLEGIFTYYLTGIVNIRDGDGDYRFELLLAGYDPDGTPEIGRLVLGTAQEPTFVGPLVRSITKERSIFPIAHRQMICVNGIKDVALEMLRGTNAWRTDPGIGPCEESTSDQKLLSIEQMKALAISLKQHTTDRYKEVGGPNQIAVLANGHVQSPIEQPVFEKKVVLSGFRFVIISTAGFDNSGIPGPPQGRAVTAQGLFGLYFRNEFIHVRQELDNAYYGRNMFKDCVLMYSGGKTQFEKTNQVINSDLEIAAGVPLDAPEVKKLVNDFEWRTVKHGENGQESAK
jgi:hypothetical protein